MQRPVTDQRVDRYILQEEIGSGGMGFVYRAIDTETGEHVALKVAGGPEARAKDFRRRFEREMETVSRLHHPNILPVLHCGSSDSGPFMVMPLVSGGTLKDFLSSGGLLTPRQTLDIVWQVGEALDYAHQQGIVHRDVKPHNIMMLSEDRVCLADFGLLTFATASSTRLTVSSHIIGTPSYMSPEHLTGAEVDGRSDLYSLGTVAYECLLGRLPFHARTVFGQINLQLRALPLPPTAINPDFPLPLEVFLLRALEKDPELRYQTGAEMTQVYEASLMEVPAQLLDVFLATHEQIDASYSLRWQDGETLTLPSGPISEVSAPSLPAPVPAGRRRLLGVFAALALLLVAGLIWIVGIQPIQARAISAEQTAQALGQQTPLVITQMVTQIVTNEAGQPVMIVITQFVTGSPGPTPTPQEPTSQRAASTPTPSVTPTSTRAPTASPTPVSQAGAGSSVASRGGGSGLIAPHNPTSAPTSAPLPTPVPPTRVPPTPVPPTPVPPTPVPPTPVPPTPDTPTPDTPTPDTPTPDTPTPDPPTPEPPTPDPESSPTPE